MGRGDRARSFPRGGQSQVPTLPVYRALRIGHRYFEMLHLLCQQMTVLVAPALRTLVRAAGCECAILRFGPPRSHQMVDGRGAGEGGAGRGLTSPSPPGPSPGLLLVTWVLRNKCISLLSKWSFARACSVHAHVRQSHSGRRSARPSLSLLHSRQGRRIGSGCRVAVALGIAA